MASKKQIQANKKNAQKSKGPLTDQGKVKSSKKQPKTWFLRYQKYTFIP